MARVIDPTVWEEVNERWGDLLDLFRSRLNAFELMKMYDDDGNVVDSDRPMIESIICDRTDRRARFFYYILAVKNDTEIKQSTTTGRKIICVQARTRMPLTIGGKQCQTKQS